MAKSLKTFAGSGEVLAESEDALTESESENGEDLILVTKLLTEFIIHEKGIENSHRAEDARREVNALMDYALKEPKNFPNYKAVQAAAERDKAKGEQSKKIEDRLYNVLIKAVEEAEINGQDELDVYPYFKARENKVKLSASNDNEKRDIAGIVIELICENMYYLVERSKAKDETIPGHAFEIMKAVVGMAMKRTGFVFSIGSHEYFLEMVNNLVANVSSEGGVDNYLTDENVQAIVKRSKAKGGENLLDAALKAIANKESVNMQDIIESDEYDAEAEVNEDTDRQVLRKYEQKLFNIAGGSYKEVLAPLKPTKKVVEVNHMPPHSSYRGTIYKNISYQNKPAIAMLTRHHHMAILWIHKLIPEYYPSVKSAIKCCFSGANAPKTNNLITGDECSKLNNILNEMLNTECNDENMHYLDAWISKDEDDSNVREELLHFLREEPKNHAAKKIRHALNVDTKGREKSGPSRKKQKPMKRKPTGNGAKKSLNTIVSKKRKCSKECQQSPSRRSTRLSKT